MTDHLELAELAEVDDRPERELAATTFDRNVVVTAGAGTGKTTLLVDRLLHLLMRNPEPLEITEIAALTFTNKAANEMKLRLRERLQSYLGVRLDREAVDKHEEEAQGAIRSFIEIYHLTKDEIDARSREALRHIERSGIGTVHSFAATLLRLYPMEAGLDPQFREDDGAWFERYFEENWAVWLDQELSGQGARREDWKQILRKISLEEMRRFAFSLCSETVQLDRLGHLSPDGGIPQTIREWLEGLEEKAANLLRQHPDGKHQIDKLTGISHRIICEILAHGELVEGVLEEEKAFLAEKEPSPVKAWSGSEFEQARELVRVARRLCQVDEKLTRWLCGLLIPFAERCREGFVNEGFVSFDGLLVRARDLVRDHLPVREELKQQFKAILVDEFQDTDPIQYEILLYLAERIGRRARHWRKVRLTPGKVFVVGDPKQSIYAFRRADIEAYLEVVQEVIKAQNGIECRLTNNFRSHAGLLNVVNGVFTPLIRPRVGLQPSYVPIHSPEPSGADGTIRPNSFPFRNAEIRRVEPEEGTASAVLARGLEGECLARWLAEEVLGKATVLDRDRHPVLVGAKDVAILLRTLTDVHQYLEPLRRRGIRYVVEGERHFYATQEVIDAVNLLRAVENPFDRSALVGLLRSPVGGLKDAEIYQLYRQNLLDYRSMTRLEEGAKKELGPLVKDLYEILGKLHVETRKLPVGEAVSRVFASLPIEILAARSFNGEQAVANLEKVRQLAELMGRQGLGTLKEVIAMLQRRVLDVKEEGESALAEENVDAVRILSVHKAKGLEFPVVVLAGCHGEIDHREAEKEVEYDWSTDLVGLKVGAHWNIPGIYLAEKRRLRDSEEQKRVLYVAMTRAREHLTVSCAVTGRKGSGSFLSMLEQAVGELTSSERTGIIPAGTGHIGIKVLVDSLKPPERVRAEGKKEQCELDWKAYANLWSQRASNFDEAIRTPLFVTPTLLKAREQEVAEGAPRGDKGPWTREEALLIGELAHRFLQHWDFSVEPKTFSGRLLSFMAHYFSAIPERNGQAIQNELEEIFQGFFSSPAYKELRTSNILGREVPLLIPWSGQVMEGVMDVLYEKEGDLYLADYKTDRIQREDLSRVIKSYHHQAQIYSEAVRRSLQRELAGFKLIFLRVGEAIQV
jgi:ATP-dependent helicase/nuclease subunit A